MFQSFIHSPHRGAAQPLYGQRGIYSAGPTAESKQRRLVGGERERGLVVRGYAQVIIKLHKVSPHIQQCPEGKVVHGGVQDLVDVPQNPQHPLPHNHTYHCSPPHL